MPSDFFAIDRVSLSFLPPSFQYWISVNLQARIIISYQVILIYYFCRNGPPNQTFTKKSDVKSVSRFQMMRLIKRFFFALIFFGCVVPFFSAHSKTPSPADLKYTLLPSTADEEACKYISQFLLQHHYRKIAAKDSLSAEILNRYFSNLDPDKSLFLASEVDSLKKIYGTRILDENLEGKVNAGFAGYNLFLNRSKEKINFMHDAIGMATINFFKPEFLTLNRSNDPWPASRSELNERWIKEFKFQWLNLLASGETNRSIDVALAKYLTVRENILNRKKPQDAFQAYIDAVTTSFDPHTSFFSSDKSQSFQIGMSHVVEGIGVKLDTAGDYTVVTEVIPGGPAYKSNLLKKGDRIIGVGEGTHSRITDVFGKNINDVAQLIRGSKGSIVRLHIIPVSFVGPRSTSTIQLMRDAVNMVDETASKSIVQLHGHKIGVITIPSFYLDFDGQEKKSSKYSSVSNDIKRLLKELKDEHIEGIVIDLRNNGGGSLEEAVRVSGLFIPNGPFVQISNAAGNVAVVTSDNEHQKMYSGPLALLVNRRTASASEIFAAAIQDYGRGVIIGERTFGKGTIQNVIKLVKSREFGEMKLTFGKFYRITGGSTQRKGVMPDIIVPSIINSVTVREDTYTSSMPWSIISKAYYRPTQEVNSEDMYVLRQKFTERASNSSLYLNYLHDLGTLEQIRKQRDVPLQKTAYMAELA